eukprot:3058672-Amphidinium_carterae.1
MVLSLMQKEEKEKTTGGATAANRVTATLPSPPTVASSVSRDYGAAYELLKNQECAKDPTALAALLTEMGVFNPSMVEMFEEEDVQ